MNLKRIKMIITVVIFALAFLTHFGYDVFPNFMTAIFFPVNESIWEHMKMLYTTVLLGSIIEYFLLKWSKIEVKNFLLQAWICAIIIIPIYLILYLPLYYHTPHSMTIILIVMFLAIAITEWIGYWLLKRDWKREYTLLTIILIVLSYIGFTILSYLPPHADLFFDPEQENYGIIKK